MIQVKCSCKVCKANAAKLGLTVPLRAEVPEALAAKVRPHGLVHMAHDPNAVTGAAARAATGVVPVL